jgi:hypothetical protein
VPGPGSGGPAAGGPATGAPNSPATPETGQPFLPPPIVRGPSSRSVLQLAWQYPVYSAPEQPLLEGRSQARTQRKALSYEEAFAFIAGDDPRPLLVLRECAVCNGTDNALLSQGVDNEKTFLFSRWFHCVKLPIDVMEDDHPFRNLFPGGRSEHLFMASRDGAVRLPLEGERSRTELWSSMLEVLTADYKNKPERSVKDVQKVLDRLDSIDMRIAELSTRVDELLETEGLKSSKLKKVRRKLGDAREERDELLAEVQEASRKLKLRRPVVEPAPAEASGAE